MVGLVAKISFDNVEKSANEKPIFLSRVQKEPHLILKGLIELGNELTARSTNVPAPIGIYGSVETAFGSYLAETFCFSYKCGCSRPKHP